jgi:hypothetical protein
MFLYFVTQDHYFKCPQSTVTSIRSLTLYTKPTHWLIPMLHTKDSASLYDPSAVMQIPLACHIWYDTLKHTHSTEFLSVFSLGESFLMLLFQTEHQVYVHKVPCPATESCYRILRSVCGVLEVQLGLLHPFFCRHHIFQITRKLMPLIGQTSCQLPSNTTIYLVILILITKFVVVFDGKC